MMTGPASSGAGEGISEFTAAIYIGRDRLTRVYIQYGFHGNCPKQVGCLAAIECCVASLNWVEFQSPIPELGDSGRGERVEGLERRVCEWQR